MELTGDLKKQVEQAKTKEEALKINEQAGIEFTDEELDQVAGGDLFSSLFVDWPVDSSGESG
ncbi:MAG: Nif11-like leader peptide family natural product precursor [Lachnospiraceae bacterium]|nr:Nif11-like leader peptide family natural product precursor [Lachnospiraceae bacterium]